MDKAIKNKVAKVVVLAIDVMFQENPTRLPKKVGHPNIYMLPFYLFLILIVLLLLSGLLIAAMNIQIPKRSENHCRFSM